MKPVNAFILFIGLFFIMILISGAACKKNSTRINNDNPVTPAGTNIAVWLTTGNQSSLLQKQNTDLLFGKAANNLPFITVDTSQAFQTVEGFGFALTGGSASLISQLGTTERNALLNELFGNGTGSIGISYLRISIGASDLDSAVFSYDDLPAGQTDTALTNFSLSPDRIHLIPLLKEILQINPTLRLMASPWSAPVWMKDNNSSVGGSLKPAYYHAYAQYLVKYIQQMQAEGITIHAITPQNEPLNPGNNPSLYMTAAQQADFIKNHLGPAFQSAGVRTKLIIYDHNADHPEYPISILNDAAAKIFIGGSAFHLYAGDISALSQVHAAHPDKGVYFTEQWTSANGAFGDDLKWHIKNVIIGSMRNWSRNALEWNLANDAAYRPHTVGGCTACKGALTVGNTITRNVSYYIIGQAAKFVPAGSVRIGSTGSLPNVAFKTPEGKKVLIVLNDGSADASFNIQFGSDWAVASLPAGGVATYVW